MTVIPLGRTLPRASSYLPAGSAGHTSTPAYLVLLQVEIARFTHTFLAEGVTRLCCSNPHLTVDGCYPLPCPVESGLSSAWQACSDRLARFRGHYRMRVSRNPDSRQCHPERSEGSLWRRDSSLHSG